MSTKDFKATVAALVEMGFEFRAENRLGARYAALDGWQTVVSWQIEDHDAKHVIHNAQKHVGVPTSKDAKKRNPETVRRRQDEKRERLAADIMRHEADILELLSQRDRQMDGFGRVLTGTEMRDIERLIEQKQREIRGWQSLMTSIPGPRADAGRPGAKHRS